VHLVPGGYGEAEVAGLDFAQASGSTWISPYNDPQVIAGQGTVGLELIQQLPPDFAGDCLVPAGGGGLVSGIGVALAGRQPKVRIIAVQPQASAFLHALITRGTLENVPDLPSLADGLAGALEPDSVTIPLVRQYVDEFILVDEEEIARAVAYAWYHYGEVIEGSAAVTLAAILSGKTPQRPAVLIFSGGNIQPEEHTRLIERYHPGAMEEIR
jgi:threonine dehydratase